MKIEKKLIALSIIAVMVGVASIMPLMFLMSAKAEPSKPWFNIAIPYAYFTAKPPENPKTLSPDAVGIWNSMVLNVTVNDDAWDALTDARLEFFQIRAYTEKGSLSNKTFFVETNRTSSAEPFPFDIENFISLCRNTSSDGTVIPYFNHTESSLGTYGGGVGEIGDSPDLMEQRVIEFKNAKTLYIDVIRLSSTTFKVNSTVTELTNNEVVQHIELKRFGDGFLYNTLLPEGQLLQDSLLIPLQFADQHKP